jgi:hypothetical protein
MAILYIRDELNERWIACVEDLDSLPDVYISANVQTGDALIYDYNSGSPRWTSGSLSSGSGGGGGASYLYALLDTDVSSPQEGEILVYTSGKWTNTDYTSGSAGLVPWDGVQNKPSTYPPSTHASSHQDGGSDEISVQGLSGVLADMQNAGSIRNREVDSSTPADGEVMVWRPSFNKWMYEAQSGSGGGGSSGSAGSGYAQIVEDLTAQIPAVANHFETSYDYNAGTLSIFYNGVHQQMSKYMEDVDGQGFTTNFSPVSGDTLTAMYFRGISSGSGALTIGVKEYDGYPSLFGIHTLVVANGDLEDLGGGFARVRTAGDVPAAASPKDILEVQVFA